MSEAVAPAKRAKTALAGASLDSERFVSLLTKLVGESEKLQNNPDQGLCPREDLASDHVLELLRPFTKAEGGPLEVERVGFAEGRGNVIVSYPGTSADSANPLSVGFVGSHMDVVPANPELWERDPFNLTVEGDKLYGRGTTDCLGHVALITDLMLTLATTRPRLQHTVTAVFIVNEENGSVEGIGVDRLMQTGKMDHLKNGPVYWVDTADSQPCIGTAGSLTWTLKATGKLFHSGLPHKGVNAIELGNAALAELQSRFYEAFPAHPDEAKYCFATASSMKPTQYKCAVGALNQIPPWVEISGDIRLTPFYDVGEVREKVAHFAREIDARVSSLPSAGASRYEIEGCKGGVSLSWGEGAMEGIACDLESIGHVALREATEAVQGHVKPYSVCGSLPLVRELQREGFDVQMVGFGLLSTYHADNEYCLLSHFQKGFQVLLRVLETMEERAALPQGAARVCDGQGVADSLAKAPVGAEAPVGKPVGAAETTAGGVSDAAARAEAFPVSEA